MDLNSILKEKKEKNTQIKNKFFLPTKIKPLWLVKISNKLLIKYLRDAFLILPASFILEINWIKTEKLWENIIATGKIEPNELIWFDFILCDDDIKNLNKYLQVWIVPITSLKNPLGPILKEFSPMKNEWNSYLFKEEEKWSIFYALVRYLENFKFPFDNKNLVKNVLDI
jgi:hypothetical protein